ncbi:hypothetical protein KIW84_033573 [Lathyrus oleraceus]|uniref:Uncharacterized protein n=1 Tax=Pisum sativum TaxID=3888 RepID=A0A9D4Y0H0_PEA|nr:hypothetical protein KIW84_033573 [Pisum sativum]
MNKSLHEGSRPVFKCDGTNSFWCEHGATCVEIAHERSAHRGFAGKHCELAGLPPVVRFSVSIMLNAWLKQVMFASSHFNRLSIPSLSLVNK